MKARVFKPKPKVLLYNVEANKADCISEICHDNGMEAVRVDKGFCAFTVGYLCGCAGYDNTLRPCEVSDSEAMIISGAEQATIDNILSKLRESNNTVKLKCIVTAHNQSWTLGKLISELEAERAKLGG